MTDLLTFIEAINFLGVCDATLWHWARSGYLVPVKPDSIGHLLNSLNSSKMFHVRNVKSTHACSCVSVCTCLRIHVFTYTHIRVLTYKYAFMFLYRYAPELVMFFLQIYRIPSRNRVT